MKLIAMFTDRDRALAFMDERFDLDILETRRFRHLTETHLLNLTYEEAARLEDYAAANKASAENLWREGDHTSVAGVQLPERPNISHDGFTCYWEGCETYNPPARVYFDSLQAQHDWDAGTINTMDRWGNYDVRCKACEYGGIRFRAREQRSLAGERRYPEISVIVNPRDSATEISEKSLAAMRDAGVCEFEMSNFSSALEVFRFRDDTEKIVRGVVNDWITVMMPTYTELERG